MAETRTVDTRLFLLGFLTLFLELLFIRYLAGNVWNLGFFPNLVLLAVFVGMGIGFVFHHHLSQQNSDKLFRFVPPTLLVFVALIYLLKPAVPGFDNWSANIGGELFFTNTNRTASLGSYFSFAGWFFSLAVIFAMISQYTAKYFAQLTPLKAYTLDIAGSCCGIVAFMAISWLHVPAAAWFLALIPLFFYTAEFNTGRHVVTSAASIGLISLLVLQIDSSPLSTDDDTVLKSITWSPYQKVQIDRSSNSFGIISVNGIGHQVILHPGQIPGSYYQSVYDHRPPDSEQPPYKSVLIIGAGSGNDVMAGLMNHVERIDAVEIDPILARIARENHPGRPYDDPRVALHIDDARSFMTNTNESYDLIIFALTDSLVKVSPMAQLRLENYLYTKESVQRAYSLLNDNGSLVFYNHYREPWLREKVEGLITSATGLIPQSIFTWGDLTVLVADKNLANATTTPSDEVKNENAGTASVELPIDDWPFLYLQRRGLPTVYLIAMLALSGFVILLLLILEKSSRSLGAPVAQAGSIPMKLAFVLMGIAFLLLETKGIIQFSLLFGTTWLTSSLVFLAVLLSVLAANWVAWLIKSRMLLWVAFVLLLVSCMAAFVYPIGNLLHVEDRFLRFVLASVLTFSPIAFANLIFSVLLRSRTIAEHYFGWNLIGATLGGVLEYTSMALGYNALAVIVAVCYALVFLLTFRAMRSSQQAESATPLAAAD